MRRVHSIPALFLLLAQPGIAEGSFNRVTAAPKAEAPAPESEEASAASVPAPVPAAPEPEPDVAEEPAPRGDACIYGPKGLIFQPRGKKCREVQPSPESSDRAPGGRCIMGADGQVLYAPPGVTCEDTLM